MTEGDILSTDRESEAESSMDIFHETSPFARRLSQESSESNLLLQSLPPLPKQLPVLINLNLNIIKN